MSEFTLEWTPNVPATAATESQIKITYQVCRQYQDGDIWTLFEHEDYAEVKATQLWMQAKRPDQQYIMRKLTTITATQIL